MAVVVGMMGGRALLDQMTSDVRKLGEQEPGQSHLSEQDVRLFLVVCTEFVAFCANVTCKIDPAAISFLMRVRDDITSKNNVLSFSLESRRSMD